MPFGSVPNIFAETPVGVYRVFLKGSRRESFLYLFASSAERAVIDRSFFIKIIKSFDLGYGINAPWMKWVTL